MFPTPRLLGGLLWYDPLLKLGSSLTVHQEAPVAPLTSAKSPPAQTTEAR